MISTLTVIAIVVLVFLLVSITAGLVIYAYAQIMGRLDDQAELERIRMLREFDRIIQDYEDLTYLDDRGYLD